MATADPYLTVSPIDDGWKAEDCLIGIAEHRIDYGLLDDGHKAPQLEIILLVILQ